MLAVFAGIDFTAGHPTILSNPIILKTVGILMVILGLGLHIWSFSTLRNWWENNKLCTEGPFRFFRHPMYAAWITFIATGVALYFNSWVLFLWIPALHLLWHKLVETEETLMTGMFGDAYKNYMKRTGRFVPRIFNRYRE